MPDQSELLFAHVLSPEDPCWSIVTEASYELRKIVFQKGQGIPADHDRDPADNMSMHFFATYPGKFLTPSIRMVGSARATRTEEGFKIGRVCTLPILQGGRDPRVGQVGTQLMEYLIRTIYIHHPDTLLYLYAQADPEKGQDVVGFYERFGFKAVGEPVTIVDILHQRMELP